MKVTVNSAIGERLKYDLDANNATKMRRCVLMRWRALQVKIPKRLCLGGSDTGEIQAMMQTIISVSKITPTTTPVTLPWQPNAERKTWPDRCGAGRDDDEIWHPVVSMKTSMERPLFGL